MSDSTTELQHLQRILKIERDAEFEMHQEYLKHSSLDKRVKDGFSWHPVEVRETGFGLGDYPFVVLERTKDRDRGHMFSGGAVVAIFSTFMNEDDHEAVGAIHFVAGNKMKVVFFSDELPHWMGQGRMGVNLRFDEKSFREMDQALELVMKAKHNRIAELREILMGFRPAEFEKPGRVDLEGISEHLNESQQEAVRDVLLAEDVAVVHGPPGTGKTTTLVEAIRLLVKRDEKVLVTAPSNAAADLLTERIAAQGVNVVRIGNLSRIDESIMKHTLDSLIKDHPDMKTVKELKKRAQDFRNMGEKYKRSFGKAEREQRNLLFKEAKGLVADAVKMENQLVDAIVRNAQVVTCTLVGSSSSYLSKEVFDTVVMDEAAQALEPAAWIPATKGRKIVLAGDPYQLPPTVKSPEAQRAGLEITLIEKCIQRLPRVSLLRTQYRMHSQIMAFSNAWFYKGQLLADASVAERKLSATAGYDQPVEFIDTAGCGFEEEKPGEGTSLVNPGEGRILLEYLRQFSFLLPSEAQYEMGVISPYKAQVEFLREEVKSLGQLQGIASIDVNTIDSFQGQERDIICLSLVRSNDRNEIGFLSDYRRMNVAMTRAKMKLVMIGDSATIGGTKFYGDVIKHAEDVGGYKSAWEYMG